MKVKELIKALRTLEPDAVIDISTDEEGNSYGDIDPYFEKRCLKKGKGIAYTMYPENCQQFDDRYLF